MTLRLDLPVTPRSEADRYAAQCGRIDALVAVVLGKPCNPRGEFIRRGALLTEATWTAYRDAYRAGYEQLCKEAA